MHIASNKQVCVIISTNALQAHKLICITSSKTSNITRIADGLGFRYVESHFAYVQKTLMREIEVIRKRLRHEYSSGVFGNKRQRTNTKTQPAMRRRPVP